MSFQTRLFVGNLPENSDKQEVLIAFSKFGEVCNLELKQKPGDGDQKKFAFVTLSASNSDIESCIQHFQHYDFNNSRLYVTRARESFLERLQRERQQTLNDKVKKPAELSVKNPIIKLGEKLNPRKRKLYEKNHSHELDHTSKSYIRNKDIFKDDSKTNCINAKVPHSISAVNNKPQKDLKKDSADLKRLDSMRKKRQEFKEKQMIIKTSLVSVDKKLNKKVVFSDGEEMPLNKSSNNKNVTSPRDKKTLFKDDDSGDEVNFAIREQFEGKKGQKVLDLQSRYKSDKRFVLDERFIEEDNSEETNKEHEQSENDNEDVEIRQKDEKSNQLNILQDVLGITLKSHSTDHNPNKKTKTKPGMLRFDPSHPEHAKFLAPVEAVKQDTSKKSKKKKSKEREEEIVQKVEHEIEKIEVSKEQFYNVSDALKEAIAQPNTFSLRSLFAKDEESEQVNKEQETGYISLNKEVKKTKVLNPLDPGERNPFKYDSSDSEDEEDKEKPQKDLSEPKQPKAVWKENLFFSKCDYRFKEALAFFSKTQDGDEQKERRELKSLMKKRIYNKERKNQMFQKKIGGKRKSMKKNFRKNK